jgi:hypothetical protein
MQEQSSRWSFRTDLPEGGKRHIRPALTVIVLGLIASVALGGPEPVPDEEVKALIAAYRDRSDASRSHEVGLPDNTGSFNDVAGFESFDGPVPPKFSVVDPALKDKGTWLAMGAALEEDAKPVRNGGPDVPPGTNSKDDLAKKSQNPISDMISVPFQNNFNFGVGPKEDFQHVLNIQPVVPFKLNKDWNLIVRTILPIISNPAMGPNTGSRTGMGDIQLSTFLSPAKSGKVIWGAGPALRFPTATDDSLGSEKFSAGPTAVFLTMDGPWVVGALAQNVWSFAGDSDRGHVNEFLLQPFVNYNLPDGWYLNTLPIITAIGAAYNRRDRWTVPIGGGLGKIVQIGKLPINLSLGAYYNVSRPTNAPEWTLQFTLTFLFPAGNK